MKKQKFKVITDDRVPQGTVYFLNPNQIWSDLQEYYCLPWYRRIFKCRLRAQILVNAKEKLRMMRGI